MAETRKAIVVRVDEEFQRRVRIFALTKGMTVQDYVLDLIKKDMEKKEGEKDEE